MMEPQSQLFADYPAAHSMDTTWYAVDEHGEIGAFDSNERGAVPLLEGMEPLTSEERMRSQLYKPRNADHRAIDQAIPEKQMHFYSFEDCGLLGCYTWQWSPEQALKIEELPKSLRNSRYLLFLKDYSFASREPINPFEYASQCYCVYDERVFPDPSSITRLPTPEHRDPWTIELFVERHLGAGEDSRAFFAVDEEGHLAIFRTDYFGAIPLVKRNSNDMKLWTEMLKCAPEAFPSSYQFEQLGPATPLEEVYDFERGGWLSGAPWLFLLESHEPGVQLDAGDFRTDQGLVSLFGHAKRRQRYEQAIRAGQVKRAWRDAWARHWLEYPFGAACPRLWGFYHYDASWLYPIPYSRIGSPAQPCHVDQLAPAWRERMQPVRLPGVRFKDAARVQPFECVPCRLVQLEETIDYFPDLWINAGLDQARPCHEFSLPPRDEELLLKRARKRCAFIESLARP